MNDEFVIYDPDQALPRYIIHFRKTGSPNIAAMASLGSLAGQPFKLTKIQTSRIINMNDPYEAHFSRAAAIFHQVFVVFLFSINASWRQLNQKTFNKCVLGFTSFYVTNAQDKHHGTKKKEFKKRALFLPFSFIHI